MKQGLGVQPGSLGRRLAALPSTVKRILSKLDVGDKEARCTAVNCEKYFFFQLVGSLVGYWVLKALEYVCNKID